MFKLPGNSFSVLALLLCSCLSACDTNQNTNIITASGNIEATEVTISSRSAGLIESFIAEEGSMVSAGDLIVKIDHSLLDVQLRQYEASAEQADAQLKLLLAGPREEDVMIAQSQVELAEINLRQAEEDKERFGKLMETNTITGKQYDDVVTRYQQAVNQFNAARETLRKTKTIVRPEEIESARANLKRMQAGADLVRKNIEDCSIYAPVSGTVTKKFAEAGEYAAPGTSLLNIADLSGVDLKVYIREDELGKVRTGQTAEIETDSFRDKKYTGEVIYISPKAEFTPKTIQTKDERTKLVYEVKIRIPNPANELKSGMPADAVIRIQ